MLKRIICEKFREKEIEFHPGLNTIIGDEIASNSIGKSSLLMIIDFVFGGSDYINKNKDAIEQLGQHEFLFEFDFKDEKLFFRRSTDTNNIVIKCNSDFEEQSQMELKDFNALLQKEYDCELYDLSFRALLGRYFRIYGKENLNEHKPIQYFDKEPSSQSISVLVKLFNKYLFIKELNDEVCSLKEKKETLNQAAKRELIPNVNKSKYNLNTKRITELTQQLETIQKDIISNSIDIAALVSEEVLELRQEKSSLKLRRNILSSRLQRIENNLQFKNINICLELSQFKLYFPNFNFDEAEKVDAFHNTLTKNLKSELKAAKEDLESQISEVDNRIKEIEIEISDKLGTKDASKYAVDKLVGYATQINQLSNENEYYSKFQRIDVELKESKKYLTEQRKIVLEDICFQINTKMNEINKQIYGDSRRSPVINIDGDRYSFSTYGDTGTGTAFANLITFDLALLDLTCLPALIHDLPLLKNIENPAMEKIISLYGASKKQIFIAIDKIHSYDETAASIVESHKAIKLSKDNTLFIKNWKNNND